MAEPSGGDWIADVAEAMAIGRAMGDRVVVIGTSTGGTLAAILAADPALSEAREGLAGVALVSPNFAVQSPAAQLLSIPSARWWIGALAGEVRGFEPQNARHARHWTTSYPTVALLPMQAVVDHAGGLDWGDVEVPALFHFAPADEVVDHSVTAAVAARWGAPATVVTLEEVPLGDDPSAHVIAGDILSPAHTPEATRLIVGWIAALPR
jgi:pimeloyl-ACP methyl ester carboxylesterase